MATYTYTNIDFGTLLPGEPWTSAKAIAAFENLLAFAEQGPNAPKMAMKAIANQLTSPGAITYTGMADYSGIYIRGFYDATSPTVGSFSLSLSTDGGATYRTDQNIASFTGSSFVSGGFYLFVDFIAGSWRAARQTISGAGGGVVSGTFAAVANNVTHFRLTLSGDTGSLGVIAEPRGGDAAS